MNIFLLNVQISSPAAPSSSLISRSLRAKWKPLAPSSIIQLLFGTRILSSTIAHIVQTATWTPKKSGPLVSYIFFIQSVKAAVSRAVGCLMKDSVCSNHLDICRCFEASHCLLRVPVHSRRSPRATSRPQLSETSSRRTRRELFGRVESAPWKSMRTWGDLLTVGGIEGGLQTTTGSPDDAAAGGKTTVTEKEWLLLMVGMLGYEVI